MLGSLSGKKMVEERGGDKIFMLKYFETILEEILG
jgi:hypothetical protein